MKVLNIKSDDFANFRDKSGKSSLFIGIGTCDWKCYTEAGIDITVCQNSELAKTPPKDIPAYDLLRSYLGESGSVVVGGLEPFTDMPSLMELARACAEYISDNREAEKWSDGIDWFVVYTGYEPPEVMHLVYELWTVLAGKCRFAVKFGRFVPDCESHEDEILGLPLVSPNQRAEEISSKWFDMNGFEGGMECHANE